MSLGDVMVSIIGVALAAWFLLGIWAALLRSSYFTPWRRKRLTKIADRAGKILWERLQDDKLLETIAQEGEALDATYGATLELCRFLALNRALPGRRYAAFGAVDRLHRRLLEHPQSYRRFCQEAFSIPEIKVELGKMPADSQPGYRRLLMDYRRAFGAEAPRKYWGRPLVAAGQTVFQYYPIDTLGQGNGTEDYGSRLDLERQGGGGN